MAINLVVLIGEDLLTTLAASHTVLLLFPELAGSELLLLGTGFDLITHSIEGVFLSLLVF